MEWNEKTSCTVIFAARKARAAFGNVGRRAAVLARCRVIGAVRDVRGQGTTEYAILVGVLVVIAILAITVFRPKVQELWDAISDGINSL